MGYGTVKSGKILAALAAATLLMAQAPAAEAPAAQAPLPPAREAGKTAQGPLAPGRAASIRRAQGMNGTLIVTGLVGMVATGIALAAGAGGGSGNASPRIQTVPATTTAAATTG